MFQGIKGEYIMFKIKNNTIYCTRGDKGNIPVTLPLNEEKTEFYKFQVGDKVRIGVYEEDNLEGCALILKEVEVTEISELVSIPLTSDETRIGDIINEPTDYWFEVILNDDTTILGYDEELGAKIFQLLPEGSDKRCDV